jgi:[ribosomal protein S18]-alanine N-acetyltransferase
MMPVIRPGGVPDLDAIAAIQYCSPEAAGWNPKEYLEQDLRVAAVGQAVAGFLVLRRVAADEMEILNLAVAPEFRRNGIAGQLLKSAFLDFRGSVFLEVRESNAGALKFYKALGFQQVSRREGYYEIPPEAAIVMKFHSC